ncbi:MAG: hypothetical protein HYY17_04905 [Planctomycetes bacterium]|nr:hypothetical protein [Planctomycetota bacterium]
MTEGEKKCEALQEHGFLAVGTTTGASGCPSDESLRPLVGHNVYLWPDNDEPGRLHMEKVGGALHRLWVTVRVIAWSEAREKGDDAADFFKRGGTVEGVRDLLRDAKPWTAATEVPKTECVPSALDASVARLAALPCLEYEKIRKGEAKKLGVRADALDRGVQAARRAAGHGAGNDRKLQGRALALADAEPWPEPVDGAALLHDLAAVFRRFLVLPDGAAEALALWSVFTHTHDTFQVSPRLAITSPEKRCGKTTLLSILGALVPRPLPASNVTAAVVFRAVEAARPTLLVDEVDTFLSNRDELRGILNSGHTRAGAYVVRCVGDDAEPRQFTTWAPVAIACIGRLPDTLADLSRAGLTEPPRVGSY